MVLVVNCNLDWVWVCYVGMSLWCLWNESDNCWQGDWDRYVYSYWACAEHGNAQINPDLNSVGLRVGAFITNICNEWVPPQAGTLTRPNMRPRIVSFLYHFFWHALSSYQPSVSFFLYILRWSKRNIFEGWGREARNGTRAVGPWGWQFIHLVGPRF